MRTSRASLLCGALVALALGVAAAGELPLAAQGFVTLMPLAAVAGLTVYGSGEGAPEAP